MTHRIIIDTCQDLIDSDFRNGFEDTVLYRVREALMDAGYSKEAFDFWCDFCVFYEKKALRLAEKWGQDIVEVYGQAHNMAKGQGCFVMPEWGC